MKLLKTNFLALHFSVFFLDNANIFSLFLLIYPEVFLVLIFSSKNINFCVLNFVYLILRSFRKFAKFKSVCVWVCVCVCVCICIYLYKCDKTSYSCHSQNTTSRSTLQYVTKFRKFINWKFTRFITYTRSKTLPASNILAFPRRLKYCIH